MPKYRVKTTTTIHHERTVYAATENNAREYIYGNEYPLIDANELGYDVEIVEIEEVEDD